MDVILAQDFGALGFVGDKVAVKNGYARNYLIPRGIAVEASSRNAKLLKHQTAQILAKKQKMKGEAEERAKKVAETPLNFKLKVTDKGRAFGSVTVRDLEKKLQDSGFDIHRRQITLQDTIRTVGEFSAEVMLHADVIVPITINVDGEITKPEPIAKEATKKAKADSDEELEEDLKEAGIDLGDSEESEDVSDSEEASDEQPEE